jgi:XcyI restriction endonuclease
MPEYTDELRRIRSVQLVSTLKKRSDIAARALVVDFDEELDWEPLDQRSIDPNVWQYVSERFDKKLVFCHPKVLLNNPMTSLYYRGLSGLSIKSVKEYVGAIEALEAGNPRARLSAEKAGKMAGIYNRFISFVIKNSPDWNLEDGSRTVVATLGITVDGSTRGGVGGRAETLVKGLLLETLVDENLLRDPELRKDQLTDPDALPRKFKLHNDVSLQFASDPDVSFIKDDRYIAVIEVKGGIDRAGALERYAAARRTFEHVIATSPRCTTFFLTAIETDEVRRRLDADGLVRHSFDIIRLVEDPVHRESFLDELLNHTLRLR